VAIRVYPVQGGTLRVSGAWAEWTPAGEIRGKVRLRVSRDRQGRKTITEVRILDPAGVPAALLRQIPLGALEDVINSPRDAAVTPATVTPKVRIPTPRVHTRSASLKAEAGLNVRDTEVFFRGVAADYTAAAAFTRHPATQLAQDRGVSDRTVSRWLAEARHRGLLPPTRRARGGS
jgi:hypothetical protein